MLCWDTTPVRKKVARVFMSEVVYSDGFAFSFPVALLRSAVATRWSLALLRLVREIWAVIGRPYTILVGRYCWAWTEKVLLALALSSCAEDIGRAGGL